MVRRRLSLQFTDVKEDDEVVTDEEINNWKWKSYHEYTCEICYQSLCGHPVVLQVLQTSQVWCQPVEAQVRRVRV